MKIITPYNKCTGCHACFSACPMNAISMRRDYAGFIYPNINQKLCVDCGICVEVCPINNVSKSYDNKNNLPTAFAYINKNKSVRYESSSGGAFTALAEFIIEQGGIVFGASFDRNFEVIHDYSKTIEEISKFRGSKYVESTIGLSLLKAKEFLQAGKLVLFSGTPCQIAGLISFLGKKYDNLITVDLICHGVPSPMVWGKYIKYRSRKYGVNPEKIAFRDKKLGWKQYSISFIFPNGLQYSNSLNQDLYMQLFLNNLCLRESCYKCRFRTIHRKSDITIADFWGIELIIPELFDNMGCSLILVHSLKGEELIKKISNNARVVAVNLRSALSYNKSMITSPNKPKLRECFIKYILYHNFTFIDMVIKIYRINKRFASKLISILKTIFSKRYY